ncbi:cysteine-rich motor neuron 1 protein [Condylostylus longicornis]|uniref:cysteine-rich motor neuron 1 protein n=1 Tax=Condylostylus longicornis TaxID=2530218 RepID=UPI00244E254E|nr:cysteine-rich motor neuron 1 protein [Condylostylus longicornis]
MSNNIKFLWLFHFRTYLIYYLCCYLLIMVAAGSRVVSGLKCYCNPQECDVIRSQDCPGKGIVLWDPCKCCKICAKTLGEKCGGPGGFSGTCEPPLQCVASLPVTTGLGICKELPFLSQTYLNCTNDQTILLEPGCEITNKKCQCWPELRICRGDRTIISSVSTDIRWHFRTLEDCQLNLQNLIKNEMEFDEDYTISPQSFSYRKLRRKRRASLRRGRTGRRRSL